MALSIRFVIASLISVWLSASPLAMPVVAQESENPLASVEIAVVRDVTGQAGCLLEVSTDGGPFESVPCPPGSVVEVARTTSAEASTDDDAIIVKLNGSRSDEEEQIERAVNIMSDRTSSITARQDNCSEKSRTIRGSYNIGNPYRIEYQLKYTLKQNCVVKKIRDKSRSNDSASGNALWIRSCSRSSTQCKDRNAVLSTGYTAGGRLPNSDVGRQYRNVGRSLDCMFLCPVDYYGHWSFD